MAQQHDALAQPHVVELGLLEKSGVGWEDDGPAVVVGGVRRVVVYLRCQG